MKIAVFYHLYYEELAIELISVLNRFPQSIDIHISISNNVNADLIKLIKENHNVKIYRFKNIGRDIYPFWKLCKRKIFDKYDYILKIHGKLSKHRSDGSFQRHFFTEALAPESNSIELINELDKNFRVLTHKKSIIQTEDKNWQSNLYWMQKLLNRHLGYNKTYSSSDFSNVPLVAGSFYWLNNNLVKFFQKLMITEDDWKESENSKYKIDGKLEHTIERLISFDLYNEKNIPLKIFVRNKGDIISSNLDLKRIGISYPSFYKNKLMRDELFVAYSIEGHISNRRIINITLFNAFKIANLSDIDIKVKNKKITNLGLIKILNESHYQNIYECKLELYGNTEDKDISISRKDDFFDVFIHKKSTLLQLANRFLSLNNTDHEDYSNFITTETLKRNRLPLFKMIRESANERATYTKIKNGFLEMSLILSKNKSLRNKANKHVFIVNSSLTAVVTARIIDYLNLKKQDILIIYHRIKKNFLLDNFESINTNIPDYEIDIHLSNSKEIFDSLLKILNKINGNFNLYSYHYFSYLIYILAWNPKCTSTNLIEEGNLNDEKIYIDRVNHNYKAYKPLSENLNFISPKIHNKIIYETMFLNLFHASALSVYKKNLDELIDDYFFDSSISDNLIDNLKYYRKDYLWHPKMIIDSTYFHVSSSAEVPYLCKTALITKESKKEIEIKSRYRKIIQGKVLIVLPVDASSISKEKLSTPLKKIFSSSKNIVIDFLKHPADKSKHNYKKVILNSLNELGTNNKVKINDLSNDGFVSDILACEYPNVIHFGSSIKRLIAISQKKINEYKV